MTDSITTDSQRKNLKTLKHYNSLKSESLANFTESLKHFSENKQKKR